MGYYFRLLHRLGYEEHLSSYLSIGGGHFSQRLLGEICLYYISHPGIWDLSKDLSNSKVQEFCVKQVWEF